MVSSLFTAKASGLAAALMGACMLGSGLAFQAQRTIPFSRAGIAGTSSTVRFVPHHQQSSSPSHRHPHPQRHAKPSTSSSLLRMSDVAVPSSEPEEKLFEGLGVGVMRDLKARLPLYGSDITEGLNIQCVAATMFLFFACLAPAVGFGGLFATATNGAIGTMEMVTSTALCGVIYALTAAQPLTIIGSTGPVLAFVACLAQLANSLKLPFLPLYAWTGFWTAGILLASSLTSASNLVKCKHHQFFGWSATVNYYD
jgi:hypothetical protein